MTMKNLLLGLVPWIMFATISARVGAGAVGYAASAALLAALLLTVHGLAAGRVTIVDGAAMVTFGLLTVVGFQATHHVQQLLVDYGRGGSAVVLASVMLVSAATVPFTEQIARERIHPDPGHARAFRAVNRRISLMRAALIYLMALGHLASGYLAQHGEAPRNALLNWVIPIALVIYGANQTEAIAQGHRPERTGVGSRV